MNRFTKGLLAVVLLGSVFISRTASAVDYNCVPLELLVMANRVHVLCAQPPRTGYPQDAGNAIRYFAVPTTETAWANRFLLMANTAMTTGMLLQFKYTAGDTTGTAYNCAATNCRKPWAVVLMQTGVTPAP